MVSRWLSVYEENERGYLEAQYYYFDERGFMQTGWLEDRGYLFYLLPSGRLAGYNGLEEIDGCQYVFQDGYVLRNRDITIDGQNYITDTNGKVINVTTDKTEENIQISGKLDQMSYLNGYRRKAGISDLVYDDALTQTAKQLYGTELSLSSVYSAASSMTGRNIRHIAFVDATAFQGSSFIYLTTEAVEMIQNPWFTRAGYYKGTSSIIVILASYDQEEAQILSPTIAQGEWIKESGRYKYRRTDGSYAADEWLNHPGDGKWYHFDSQGYMQTGWFQDVDGTWYYLDPNTGAMLTDATTPDGYVVGENGAWLG